MARPSVTDASNCRRLRARSAARLLDGLAESIAERGYRATTVADVVRQRQDLQAHVLRRIRQQGGVLRRAAGRQQRRPDRRDHQRPSIPRRTGRRADRAPPSAPTSATSNPRPAITLSWIREAPALGAAARPLTPARDGNTSPTCWSSSAAARGSGARAWRRSHDRWRSSCSVGLRELTALLVEDGQDVQDIIGPAVTAATRDPRAAPVSPA